MYENIICAVYRHLDVDWQVSDIFQNFCSIRMCAMLEMFVRYLAAISVPEPECICIIRIGKRLQHHVFVVAQEQCDVFLFHRFAQNVQSTRAAVDDITENVQMVIRLQLDLLKYVTIPFVAAVNIRHHIDHWLHLRRGHSPILAAVGRYGCFRSFHPA